MKMKEEPPAMVKNVMTKPVVTVDVESSVLEAAKAMAKKRIGSIVVTENAKPVGIVTERDIVQRVVAKGLAATRVKMKDVMSKPLLAINGDMPLVHAVRFMEKNKVRRLLIIENDELVGIITQRDLLRALAFHVLISFRPII